MSKETITLKDGYVLGQMVGRLDLLIFQKLLQNLPNNFQRRKGSIGLLSMDSDIPTQLLFMELELLDSQEISKRLRHSRVSTTDDIYIHVTEEIKKSTAQLFDQAIDSKKRSLYK